MSNIKSLINYNDRFTCQKSKQPQNFVKFFT